MQLAASVRIEVAVSEIHRRCVEIQDQQKSLVENQERLAAEAAAHVERLAAEQRQRAEEAAAEQKRIADEAAADRERLHQEQQARAERERREADTGTVFERDGFWAHSLCSARLESILKPVHDAAHYSSAAPKPCDEGTRVEILGMIETWAQNLDSPRVFWLAGLAGTA